MYFRSHRTIETIPASTGAGVVVIQLIFTEAGVW